MAIINKKLKNIKGYYCNCCEAFCTHDEIKHRYTVEVVGNTCTITKEELLCPNCGYHSGVEEFTPEEWSPLAALVNAQYKENTSIKVPVYDNDNDLFPVSYKTVRTVQEVEDLADWQYIDVKSATLDEFDILTIEVDFW